MDTIIVCILLIPALLLHTANLITPLRLYLSIIISFVLFIETINLFYFQQFSTRLDKLFIDNIRYANLIWPMIFKDYSLILIAIFFALPASFIFTFRLSTSLFQSSPVKNKLIIFPFALILLVIGGRTSFNVASPNPSYYSWSRDNINNELTNNTIFSIASSAYYHENFNLSEFGTPDKTSDTKTYQKEIESSYKKKRNIILIVMESLGSRFVKKLGGINASPNFDKLTENGFFIQNMYASSNRTNRGLEAILSSIYPFVGNTYLKLPESTRGFWTVASTLKQQGYQSTFLYGGDSKFDNMKAFLLSNGFNQVIDSYTLNIKQQEGAWGYADEYLYNKTIKLLKESSKPQFITLLTLSNHEPFDYPKRQASLLKEFPAESYENAAVYSDWALGNFVNQLKQDNYFKDSLLVIVADHSIRTDDSTAFPFSEYHIPALFLADDLPVKKIDIISHQADIAPTLLDAAGISTTIPAQGFDLLKDTKSRALILRRNAYAFLTDGGYAIFQPKQHPIGNPVFFNEGLSLIHNSYLAYKNRTHRSIMQQPLSHQTDSSRDVVLLSNRNSNKQ